jgi:hypothetical protein
MIPISFTFTARPWLTAFRGASVAPGMTTIEPDDAERTVTGARRHMTTVVLESRDGEWLATQGGIPVEGRGETAAEAAAAYCRKIDEGVHESTDE